MTTKSTNRMPGDNLRIAIVGYGIAGANFHAPVIASTPLCAVSAIVTKDELKRRRASNEYPSARLLDSAEDIWRHADQYDAVVIASPNRTHVEFAEQAMKSGLAVVLDKPMAPTYADCQRLINVRNSTNGCLAVFHNRRWDGDFLTVKQLIENNTLGKISRLESHFDRWRPTVKAESWRERANHEEGGGLLFDLGSHLIDQALQLFGIPLNVYCESNCRRESAEVDDDTFVALTFADDVSVHLWMTNLAAIPTPRFRLTGTQGNYEKFGMDPQEEALKAGLRPSQSPLWGEEPKSAWGKFACERDKSYFEGSVKTVPGDYIEFYRQFRSFVFDGAPPPVSAEEAAMVIRIIELAKQSAAEKRVVDLQPLIASM